VSASAAALLDALIAHFHTRVILTLKRFHIRASGVAVAASGACRATELDEDQCAMYDMQEAPPPQLHHNSSSITLALII
jgi:hypothetical protein